MSQSTNLALPYLTAGQAQKHVTVNDSFRRLDAIVQLAVVSATTTAQPGSPADGAVYILPSGKTGAAWGAMTTGALAYWRDGVWEQVTPREGWIAWVKDTDVINIYSGTAWNIFSAGVNFSATDRLLGRSSAGAGAAEEIVCTSFARSMLDDANAAALRSTIGLGSAATANTGTSGANIPLLNASNTFGAKQTFSSIGATTASASSALVLARSGTNQFQGLAFTTGSNADGALYRPASSDNLIVGFDLGGGLSAHTTFHQGGGVTIGSPTGGNTGGGTLNASAVYDDNTLLTCYVIEHWIDGKIDTAKWDSLVLDRDHPAKFAAEVEGYGEDGEPIFKVVEKSPAWTETRNHMPARGFASVGDQRLDIDALALWVRTNRRLPAFPGPERWQQVFEGKMGTGDGLQRLWETVEVLAVHLFKARERELSLEARIAALEAKP